MSPPITATRSDYKSLEHTDEYDDTKDIFNKPLIAETTKYNSSVVFQNVVEMQVKDEQFTDDEETPMLNYPTKALHTERFQSLRVLGTSLDISDDTDDHHKNQASKLNDSITVVKLAVRCSQISENTIHEEDTATTPLPHSEIITEALKNDTDDRETERKQNITSLLQRYFRRWTHYVTFAKLTANGSEPHRTESRAAQIDLYLRAMRLEKTARKAKQQHSDDAPADGKVTTLKRQSEISGFAAGMMVKKFSSK